MCWGWQVDTNRPEDSDMHLGIQHGTTAPGMVILYRYVQLDIINETAPKFMRVDNKWLWYMVRVPFQGYYSPVIPPC